MSREEPTMDRIYWIVSNLGVQGTWPEGLLSELLPRMNHHAEFYVLSEDLANDRPHLVRLKKAIHAHLHQWGFCRISLKPVHPVEDGQNKALDRIYCLFHQWGEAFYEEALKHQVASRWMVLPVLRVLTPTAIPAALNLAELLREKMMVPSYSLPAGRAFRDMLRRVDTDRERLIMEDGHGPLVPLVLNGLVDDLLQWALSSSGGVSAKPCDSLVVDTVRGMVGRCHEMGCRGLTQWKTAIQSHHEERCLRCWHALPQRMREPLRWNRRDDEADQIEQQLGVCSLSQGDIRNAEHHFRHLASESSSVETRGASLLYLGIIQLEGNDISSAHASLTEASRMLAQPGEALYHLGRCEFLWQDYIAASDRFREALNAGVSPETERDLVLYLGISHIQLEEYAEAFRSLDRIPVQKATNCFYRAMALLGLGNMDEALETFRTALTCGPEAEDLAQVHFYIGHCLKEVDRWGEAISHLNAALEADPRHYESWNLMGYCRFRLKQHHEAIQAFLEALKIHPQSAIDYANVGSNLRDLGDRTQAARWYRKALRLDPSLGFAAENLRKLEDTNGP